MADRHCTERALSCAALPDADPSMLAARARSAVARPSAYHEAGHAVVGLVLGADVLGVEIEADGSGVTRLSWPGCDPNAQAVALFAGTLTEARYRKQSPWCDLAQAAAEHDWLAICKLANVVDSGDQDPLEEWERGARAMVSACWPEIVCVATALCARGGRLSGAEVSELVAEALPCRE